MWKKCSMLSLSIYYIGTVLIATFTVLTYLKRRDEALLFSQSLLILITLINSILATIKYKKKKN
ncbi:hypothetical protein [Clostridium sp.]|uniref:hypothetical protein n=1 Tax=Clostridium sp. TaxID=1506 RepID=UPI00261CC172|nr:hypothetical protein [Clostridium sp.]